MAAKRTRTATDRKGRILEKVVALLQQAEFEKVETRVQLSSKRNPGRTREIDILVTLETSLQPLRIPYECKNWGTKVGVQQIGEFRDKIEDCGLAVPHGVYVTTKGYTAGAIERAEDLGITLLQASGLTPDRLRVSVERALHNTVFVFLSAHALQPMSDVTNSKKMVERETWALPCLLRRAS